MRRSPRLAAALSLALALAPVAASDAQTVPVDPAARGLDVFLHAPPSASPGAPVPVQIEAFGFSTATTLVPLASAALTAAWDPESLGPGVSAAPPPVRTTADAAGRAHLDVPMPDGDERALTLLVGVRSGSHERTRKVQVRRGPLYGVAVHVADTQVVPGGEISAWVVVTSAATGEAAAGAKVELALVEGGMPRTAVTLAADAAGTAMARVPIPTADEPSWSWQLRARALGPGGGAAGSAELRLTPREETPGLPRLGARFASDAVLAGDRASFTLRVRDATDRPIAGLPVRYWVGPKGTEPPRDTAGWDRAAKAATTDGEGEVQGAADAPALVVAGVGTTLRLIARTIVEGHALEDSAAVSVGVPVSTAELLPEAGSIVPGVEQHMLLRVRDGRGHPVAATFSVEADGLAATVTTGADGDAELGWRPPADVGALRNVGPCAGGVAAAVIVRPVGDVPALRPRRDPFSICLPVGRELGALVAFDRPIARMGERVHVRVLEPAPARGAARVGPDTGKTAWSLLLRAPGGARAASLWIEDGAEGADLPVPTGEPGAWTVEAVAPATSRRARVAEGAILVTPRVLPVLAASLAGGRAAPGGAVDVDADLSDGHGRGMPGTVAAFVVDLHGGGSVAAMDGIDARRSLCSPFGVEDERCDRFVEGDPALDPLRRGVLGERVDKPAEPQTDPGGRARDELYAVFGEVLRSLEGAVFEATGAVDRLGDVRRRGPRGWGFNPELMTLVTAAMDPPPRTPGGELLSLADLVTVDPQVTFDNVARRVTRLKLLRLLVAVRAYRHEHQLDADEPALRDPNALLRKLTREGTISEDQLLDPWGGTIQFVPARGPALPFLSVVHGFELHAPGPDGRPDTADDVRDPFERVLRTGTPYARAVGEDRIVDAKLDMEVGDATVTAWQALLEELTGTALGSRVGTLGHGGGSGTGQGFGSGHGRLGGSHRSSAGVTRGVHWWAAPLRTDARGHVRFHVSLGDAETTWRVVLVGVPDGARQAVTHVDVPVALPLSARVDTGARWVEGDAVEAAVTVRNRTGKAVRAVVTAAASGVASIDPKDATRSVDVPAGGAAVARVPVRAPSPGRAGLEVTVRAPDLPEDVVHHTWEVIGAGEPTDLTRAQWVEGEAEVAVSLGGDEPGVAKAMRPVAAPRLVLERGLDRPLAAALEAMDPDRLGGREALVDAVEVASRIERWATAKDGERSPTAARAAEIGRRARGRIEAYGDGGGDRDWIVKARLRAWAPPGPAGAEDIVACPPSRLHDPTLSVLDAEPPDQGGAAMACWDAAVSSAMDGLGGEGSAVDLARAFLALIERPHRESLAVTLIDRLREKAALRPSGAITLPDAEARNRASRAVVYAALLRGVPAGKPSAAPAPRLAAWIGVQRDADGGYGSALATREVVRALLHAGIEDQGTARVVVTSGALRREVEVPPSGRVEVRLDAAATRASIAVQGPGVVARLERPVLRLWSRPPDAPESPLRLDVSWPSDARAGTSGVVRVSVRQLRGRATPVDVRIPLPPGVALAEPVNGVRQVQGVIAIRREVGAGDLPTEIDVPVRFGLAGRVTVPEAQATLAFDEAPRAVAPARPLVVQQ